MMERTPLHDLSRDELIGVILRLQKQSADLEKRNAELAARNEELARRIEELEKKNVGTFWSNLPWVLAGRNRTMSSNVSNNASLRNPLNFWLNDKFCARVLSMARLVMLWT